MGKLQENRNDVSNSLTLKVQHFWTSGSDFFPLRGPQVPQLHEVTLNITMELEQFIN